MFSAEIVIAVLTIAGTILGTVLTLRSQARKDSLGHDVEMAKLQEEIRQALLEELHNELARERGKRVELEARVSVLEEENRMLVYERQKRIELERLTAELRLRVTALEAENRALKKRLSSDA